MTELTLLERVDAILARHGIIPKHDGEDFDYGHQVRPDWLPIANLTY